MHGELVARGANVMRGYWNDPQTRPSHFETECFARETSDIRIRTGYFYILDRLKDMLSQVAKCLFRRSRSGHLQTSRGS